MKTIALIYEKEHIAPLVSHLSSLDLNERKEIEVYAIGYDIEESLREKNISFNSLQDFHSHYSFLKLASYVHDVSIAWYENIHMDFFTYDAQKLGRAYEWVCRSYFWEVGYYADIVEYILKKHSDSARVWIPESFHIVTGASGVLAKYETRALIDIVTHIGKEKNIEVIIQPISQSARTRGQARIWLSVFVRKTALFFVTCLNLFNSLRIKVRSSEDSLRIFVSDYWRNVSPFISKLDADIVMMDRQELKNMNIRQILKTRVRFYHPEHFTTRKIRNESGKKAEEYKKAWQEIDQEYFRRLFTYNTVSLWPVISKPLNHIISKSAEDLVTLIESFKNMLGKLNSNRVILRASVSGQIHFFALAKAATAKNILNVELQHGLEDTSPDSFSAQKNTRYMATYGKYINEELQKTNNMSLITLPIGSPRFDTYSNTNMSQKELSLSIENIKLNKDMPIVLCIMPDIAWHETSYHVHMMIEKLAALQKALPSVQLILKVRPGDPNSNFFRNEAEKKLRNFYIAQKEPLSSLFAISTLCISVYSTVIIEALISKIPLIAWGLDPFELKNITYNLNYIIEHKGIYVPTSEKELESAVSELISKEEARKNIVQNALQALRIMYSFDGHSADRMARFLKNPDELTLTD
jgi:glycosyltransferase involved in cell wall biosynthesis